MQVKKDAALLNDPDSGVKCIQWIFGISPTTGKGGPTGPLKDLLEKSGIEIIDISKQKSNVNSKELDQIRNYLNNM